MGLVSTLANTERFTAVRPGFPLQMARGHIMGIDRASLDVEDGVDRKQEFAEDVPEYLRDGYRALMNGDGYTAIGLWESLYERYPSAEVCGHLARANYYQIFFLQHEGDHPKHIEHIRDMRRWAERALALNPNSSIGHAMLAAALGREAQVGKTQKSIIMNAWQVRYHAEQSILIDNNWIGHYILAMWHREIAGVRPSFRALAQLFYARRFPRGTYEESFDHFNNILKQFPDNNVIYAEMAYTYYRMGDKEQARVMYRKCLELPTFKHPVTPYFLASIKELFTRELGM